MKDYQEALDNIRELKTKMYVDFVYRVATKGSMIQLECAIDDNLNTLQELVDIYPEYLELKAKATSKRVIGLSVTHDGLVGNCPNCNKFVRQQDSKQNVCECTQMLDWSKE